MEEKFLEIANFRIRYLEGGEGNNLLFLPGVYCSCDDYHNLIEQLSERYRVYGLDLPGFGRSSQLGSVLAVDDYTKIAAEFIKKLKLKHLTIVAHSAGGLVALNLRLYRTFIKNIVLIDSAGISNNLTMHSFMRLLLYEFLELYKGHKLSTRIRVFTSFSSRIIKSLFDKNLRNTISNGLNYNFETLDKIKIPVLILWGENDKITPISNAYDLKERLKYSRLVIVKNSTHAWCMIHPEKVIRVMELEKF